MIYQTIDSFNQFRAAFKALGRETHFSPEALEIIFDALNEADESIELGVIALCCEYDEAVIEAFAFEHGISADSVLEFLSERTFVLGERGGVVVYQGF